jgi:hypothetical protein
VSRRSTRGSSGPARSSGCDERLAFVDLADRLLDELERPIVDSLGGALSKQEATIHIGHGSNLTLVDAGRVNLHPGSKSTKQRRR